MTDRVPPRPLDRGLELRVATEADIDAIVALETDAFGAADEPGVRGYLTGPGASVGNWALVTDADRVVSASALLPVTMVLDGHHLPAGQIEFVATDPAYRRRGLTRALIDHHHEQSRRRGQLAQFIGGIPYLYRRFGYGYGVDFPDLFLVDRARLQPAPDLVIRPATPDDLPAIHALDETRPMEELRVRRDDDSWLRWMAIADHPAVDGTVAARLLVAARGARTVGWAVLTEEADEDRLYVLPSVTADAGVTDALLAHALDLAGASSVVAYDTPGTAHGRRVRAVGRSVPYGLGIYVRIPDPVALLDHLRPALSARLAASPLADEAGEVGISLYERGLAIAYDRGSVTGIRDIPPNEDPYDDGECGVAPDWFPALVLGRWGATALADRTDDVTLGHHTRLLEVLFPRRDADVVGDL